MKKLKRYFFTIGAAAVSAWAFRTLTGLVPFASQSLMAFFVLQYGAIVGLLSLSFGAAYIREGKERLQQYVLFHLVTLHQLMFRVRPVPSILLCCALYLTGVFLGTFVIALAIAASEECWRLED